MGLALLFFAEGHTVIGTVAFVAALNRGRWPDALIRTVFQIGLSMPVFDIGMILLTFLAAQLRWFPVGGYGETFGERLYHLFLPAVAVALYTSAIIMRNLRSAIIEVVDAEYVQFARAKGLPTRQILGRHVLRNALISTVTLLGLSIGNLMSGTLVTETVFAVPGFGRLMLEEIYNHSRRGKSFAFETTLSGRGYAGLIPGWCAKGYIVKLFFLRLASPELAIARVRQRVREGGHNIPEPIIRRRFASGLSNFENLYKPAVDEWALYDNSGTEPILIEEGVKS